MKKGFTLSELLMALTIVGVIATLTVPTLMSNVHNKMFANQVKNMSATLEQLAQDQLVTHRTRDLSDTDFGDPAKLLSNDHFSISKSCTTNASTDCWKTSAAGKEKITYKKLNRTAGSFDIGNSIILKNGVLLTYAVTNSYGDDILGYFVIDINGNDKPNIIGRDTFAFLITTKGHITDVGSLNDESLNTKITKCKAGDSNPAGYCYGALADGGWEMDY